MPEARWLSLTRLGPRHIPVVGPTEALRGRPGGPGMAGPRGAVPGLVGHQRRSGWQLARQVWQDAGVDWEAATATDQPDPYEPGRYEPSRYEQSPPEPTAYGPDPFEPGPYEPDPDELEPDEPHPVRPESYEPEPDVSGPVRPQSYEPEPDVPGPVRPQSYESESYKSESYKSESDEPDRDEPDRSAPGLPEPGRDEPGSYSAAGYQADHGALSAYPGDKYRDILSPGERAATGQSWAGAVLDGTRPAPVYPDDFYLADGDAAGTPAAAASPADAQSTRPDLPVLREPADSRFGAGPWPVQRPATATTPQPVLADEPHSPAPNSPAPHSPGSRLLAPRLPEPRLPEQRPSVPPPLAPHLPAPRQPGPRPPASRPPAPHSPAPHSPAPHSPAPHTPAPRLAPPAWQAPAAAAPSAFATPGAIGAPPAYISFRRSAALDAPAGAPPLGAPVGAPPLNARQGAALGAPLVHAAPLLGDSDELFRAWQGSVQQATARRSSWPAPRPAGSAARRRRAWQAARIGVPAAVIVTVGAGALMMLTGRANEMLAQRASTGALSSAAPGASVSLGIGGQGAAGATLSGYPGQHGAVAVAALWSAGDTIVAIGYANGHPAVWRHTAGGPWSLVSATLFGGLTGHLTSVAQGPAGWIAVGSAIGSGTAEPVAFWSADGVTWSPLPALTALARADAQFLGVASGPGGYAVVGRQGTGSAAYASFWWSANLRDWASDGDSGNTGSAAAAAVAVGNGFVAVGAAAQSHAVWTSADGRQWTEHDLTKPSGATSATLQSAAAGAGGRFVAAGFAAAGAVDVPIVVTSTGAGAPLTQVVLGADGATATVTGVTTTSRGFVAVGLAGPAGERHAVEWTSPDGLTWSAAAPLTAAGTSAITALTGSGTTATGTAQRGGGPAVLTIPSR